MRAVDVWQTIAPKIATESARSKARIRLMPLSETAAPNREAHGLRLLPSTDSVQALKVTYATQLSEIVNKLPLTAQGELGNTAQC